MDASAFVTGGFVVLPLAVAAGFVASSEWAGRRLGEGPRRRRRRAWRLAAAVAGWLLLTAAAAAGGVFRRFDAVPSPFLALPLAVAVLGVALSFSPLGTLLVRGLPLSVLVGFQAFRFPLELVMHQASVEGVMPIQMSYAGQNWDILTGIAAVILGIWLAVGRVPRWIVAAWNLAGCVLLGNVVAIAIVSTPLFRWFGDDRLNVFITYPPFVWLPAVLVTAAMIGHILVWRRLCASPERVARTVPTAP